MNQNTPSLEEIQETIYRHTKYFIPLAVLECIRDMLSGKIHVKRDR